MKKRNLKTQIKENPLRAFALFVVGYLVANGIVAAINNPELFLKGFNLH